MNIVSRAYNKLRNSRVRNDGQVLGKQKTTISEYIYNTCNLRVRDDEQVLVGNEHRFQMPFSLLGN